MAIKRKGKSFASKDAYRRYEAYKHMHVKGCRGKSKKRGK